MVLFIMLYKMILSFESVDLIIQMKVIKLYFESMDEITKRNHSNEKYRAVQKCTSLWRCLLCRTRWL